LEETLEDQKRTREQDNKSETEQKGLITKEPLTVSIMVPVLNNEQPDPYQRQNQEIIQEKQD
jgi:hypothetical protein